MTLIDPAMLMAYADGELDPLTAKRVERAIEADPSLAEQVAAHRGIAAQIAATFAPVAAEPVPDRLAALLQSNVVAIPPARPALRSRRWYATGALAASLALGLALGHGWPSAGSIVTRGDRLYAAGPLAEALDTQLASVAGSVRVPVSFRDPAGRYCRVFSAAVADGIACHDSDGWRLRQTRAGAAAGTTEFRQAGSADADVMAAAQSMMTGDPLDATAETRARAAGWR